MANFEVLNIFVKQAKDLEVKAVIKALDTVKTNLEYDVATSGPFFCRQSYEIAHESTMKYLLVVELFLHMCNEKNNYKEKVAQSKCTACDGGRETPPWGCTDCY